MSATSARLLHAAAEIVGGRTALACRLGIEETLLYKYMAAQRELPDALLLRAVDLILADRQERYAPEVQPALRSFPESSPEADLR